MSGFVSKASIDGRIEVDLMTEVGSLKLGQWQEMFCYLGKPTRKLSGE